MTTTHTTLVNADPEVVEKIGKAFAEGVVTTLAKWFVIWWIVVAICTFGTLVLGAAMRWDPPDDSDVSWTRRSGMAVHRDHLTGCEYLETKGALVARRSADGRQICRVAQ